MEKSDTTGELAKALAIVQSKLEGTKKDGTNPFFKMSYATLASVWDACREPLTSNGLSVVQTFSPHDENLTVDTTLLHSSGEWISGSLTLHLTKNDPQGAGSAITYGRRYSLAAIVGLSPEDDDAEGATKREPAKATKKEPPKKNPEEPEVFATIRKYCTALKWDKKRWEEYLHTNHQDKTINDLTKEELKTCEINLKTLVQVENAGAKATVDKETK